MQDDRPGAVGEHGGRAEAVVQVVVAPGGGALAEELALRPAGVIGHAAAVALAVQAEQAILEPGAPGAHPLDLARPGVAHRNGASANRGDTRRLVGRIDQTTGVTPAGGAALAMAYTGASQAQRVTAGGAAFQHSLLN